MEASEVWERVHGAFDLAYTNEKAHSGAIAIIEQAIRDSITEDRRSRTFTVSELDKARAEGRAEGMERAAVIAGYQQPFGPRDDFSRGRLRGREEAATAIRADKGADHAG